MRAKNWRLIGMYLLTCSTLAAAPIDVGNRKQLFIDGELIEAMTDVELTVNPPAKAGAAFPQDKPWESGGLLGSAILTDGDLYRMYYNVYEFTKKGTYGPARICYAESDDGITWRKPSLGQVEYKGSKDNNILNVPGGSVIIDPNAPEDRRYKMLCIDGEMSDLTACGLYLFYSKDGMNWSSRSERLFPFLPDGTNQIIEDPVTGKYLIYLRQWFPRSAGDYFTAKISPLRSVGMLEVEDVDVPWPYDSSIVSFRLWGEGKVATPSAEMITVIAADHRDPPETDFYSGAIMHYPWADRIWLAFPALYHHFPGPTSEKTAEGEIRSKDDGTFELQFAASRDGRHWTRYRGPYVAPGHPQTIDTSLGMYMSPGMIRQGNEIYQYYSGCSVPRSESPHEPQWTRLYRTVQRIDSFISADAAYEGGTLITKPLLFAGRKLMINVDNRGAGITCVELLDDRGTPVPGFTAADCDPIRGNHFAKMISWNGNSDLSVLTGKSIRLRFAMHSAKLFGFQFSE